MKCIIVDDESKARELLIMLLARSNYDVEICAQCEDLPDAERAIEKYDPDIIFLDIQMPLFNGFQIYERNPNLNAKIVFITAHDEFAIDAFEKNANDYLLKPIDPRRLNESLERCQISLENDALRANESTVDIEKKLKFKFFHQGEYKFVLQSDIVYLRAERSYSELKMIDGSRFILSKSLSKIEQEFEVNRQFLRVHRSWIINLNYIDCRNFAAKHIGLQDNTLVPVGNTYKKELKSHIDLK